MPRDGSASRSTPRMPSPTYCVLIVEDDVGLALLYRDALQEAGYRCETVASSAACRTWLAGHTAELLLLDISLPDQDGTALIGELAAAKSLPPFIVVTGHGDERTAVNLMKLGARDYLVKDSGLLDRLRLVVARVFREIENERRFVASERRFQAIFEGSDDALMLLDESGFLDCNSRTLTLFGWAEKKEFLGLHPSDVSPPAQADGRDSPTAARELIAGALRGEARRFEWLHQRRDGSVFPAEVLLSPFELEGRMILQAAVRDITARKLSDAALRASETRYRHLLRSATDYIYTVEFENGQAKSTTHGPGCERVTGYLPEEYAARPLLWYEMIHPEDRAAVLQHTNQVHQGAIPKPLRHRLIHKDGSIRWVRNTLVPRRNPAGQLTAYDGLVSDITERKRAEEALRESEKRFRAIVSESAAGYFRIDREGRFEDVNPAWLRMHGFADSGEVVGRHFSLTQVEEDLPRARAMVERLLRGDSIHDGEFTRRRRDGSAGYHTFSMSPVRRGGEIVGFEGFLIDTTVLREVEAHHQMLFERMIDGFAVHEIICDLNGQPIDYRFLAVNPAFERLTGLRETEVVGRTFAELWPKPDPFWVETYGRVALTGESISFQHFSKELGRHFEVSAFRPAPRQFACVFVDVTERVRAEDKVRILSRAVEQSSISIVITNLKGEIEYVNPKFSSVTGYTAEEVLGKNPRILKSGHIPDAEYRHLWETISGGREWRGQFRNRKKNGELFWEEAAISPIRDGQGIMTHFLAVKEDITAEREAQGQIREQAVLLDQTQDAVLVVDLDRRLKYGNRRASQLYGGPADQLPGQLADALLFPDEPARCAEVCQMVLSQGGWSGEIRQTLGWAETRYVQSRWTLVHTAAGQPASFLVTSTDITETKRLEEQFLRSQRMESLGTLASGVAHDLNNILSPVLLVSDLFTPKNDHEKELLAVVRDSAQRGANIVKQLLLFGRGVEGQRGELRLRTMFKEQAKVMLETFPKSITVEALLPPEDWTIHADPTQIHQVLLNLCVNARDAMPRGGRLTLSVERLALDEREAALEPEAKPGVYLVMGVGDTGMGIPQEILDKVFDPFFTTKEEGKGTGLGLSTVLGIAKSHGGFVRVQSRVGQGSLFKVYLPAVGETATPQPTKSTKELPRGRGQLVLVVDDEDAIRGFVGRVLAGRGYRVFTAANGAEGIVRYMKQKEEIQAIVTDMVMPIMDGQAMVRAVRQLSPDIPIIAMSGLPEQLEQLSLSGLELNACLTKPFLPEQLILALDRIFRGDGKKG